jgi:hypothetical protein
MRRGLMIAAMALLVAWSTEASANLIVNGGFENSTFAPWIASGDVTIDTSTPNSGAQDAAFFGVNGMIQQTVPTLGTNFTLSFFLNNGTDLANPGSSSFVVNFGGNQVASFGTFDLIGQGYVFLSYNVTASNPTTLLSFTGSNDSGTWNLDDVSLVSAVTAVAEPPSIWMLGGALALLFGLSFTVAPRLRPMRKRVA